MSSDLQPSEAAELERLEGVIEQGLRDSADAEVRALMALASVKKQKLYRTAYGTFEMYCEQRWGISRSAGWRRALQGSLLLELEAGGENVARRDILSQRDVRGKVVQADSTEITPDGQGKLDSASSPGRAPVKTSNPEKEGSQSGIDTEDGWKDPTVETTPATGPSETANDPGFPQPEAGRAEEESGAKTSDGGAASASPPEDTGGPTIVVAYLTLFQASAEELRTELSDSDRIALIGHLRGTMARAPKPVPPRPFARVPEVPEPARRLMTPPSDCKHPIGRRIAKMCMECGATLK